MATHVLENSALRVEIDDRGAELCRVYDREGGCERLWSADPAVWNRHAPILFPFVGKVVDGKYRTGGREYAMKTQHGFARDREFACLEQTAQSLTQELCADEESKRIYPFDFRLRVAHRLDAEDARLLHIEWAVTNEGDAPMYFAIGGHPGFLVPEGARKEDCFLAFPGRERLRYISADSAGFALPDAVHELTLCAGVSPCGETLPETWIFEDGQLDAVELRRPDKSPWVTLNCAGFPLLAVWAKADGPFVCLEPWYGRTDDAGFTGELADKVSEQRLNAGETKRYTYSIRFHR